ncbi:hypothetical protein FS749_014215 [Ceratobasidium sp. UAMH 11750]|nr:hypothetical protein FS749_014215 [Ceratobasidium sp. UAMH 11750]
MWIQQDLFSRHYVRDGEEYRKNPRALAGSRIRHRPTGTGDSCPYAAAASNPTSASASVSGSGSVSSSPHLGRRPSGSAGSSTASSVTGTESVAWNAQPLSNVPGDGYEAWNRVRSNLSMPTSPQFGRNRSVSNMDDVFVKDKERDGGRPGLWRRIFGA